MRENNIKITLPFPPSANTAYPTNKRGGRHLSVKGKVWRDEAEHIIKITLRDCNVTIPFALHIELWMPDRCKRDVDNYIKLPKDALCAVLGIDDSYHEIPRVAVEFGAIDKKEPRCVLTVFSNKVA